MSKSVNLGNFEDTLKENEGRLSISRCRKILGKENENLTDEQVDSIRIMFEIMADMAIASFMRQKAHLKKHRQVGKESYNGK